jgi:Predicted phosphohydrolases
MSPAGRLYFSLILFTLLLTFQNVTLFSLKGFLKRKKINLKKRIIFILIIFFNVPYLIFVLSRMEMASLPVFIYYVYVIPFFVFQMGSLFTGLVISVYSIIKSPFALIFYLIKKFKTVKNKIENLKSKKNIVKFNKSRRDFIAGAGFLIAGYAFIGSGVGILRKDKFDITYQNVYPDALPAELDGFSMTLVSDIHCGPYMMEDTLMEYVTAINSLDSDIICIPGDITNTKENEVYPFIKTFSGLKAKYGVYATLGNHDYFSKPDVIANAITADTDIKMLRNDSKIIYINKAPLIISGTEDTRASAATVSNEVYKYLSDTFTGAEKMAKSGGIDYSKTKKILLYHKPYVFDELADKNYDLMLSGHTHGGQVVFAKIGNLAFSFASSVSKYVQGYFSKNNFNMYVSRGIGTVGLPIRLNCPPEITKLTLRKK